MKWFSSILFYIKIDDKTKNSLHSVFWSKHYHMVLNKIIFRFHYHYKCCQFQALLCRFIRVVITHDQILYKLTLLHKMGIDIFKKNPRLVKVANNHIRRYAIDLIMEYTKSFHS